MDICWAEIAQAFRRNCGEIAEIKSLWMAVAVKCATVSHFPDYFLRCAPMLNRLWQKLFLALAVLSVSTLLAMYLLQQRAFQRDFLDYVNRIGIERLALAAARIGKRHDEVGDWSFIARQPRSFESFISGEDVTSFMGPAEQRDEKRGFRERPPRDERGPPPPRDRANEGRPDGRPEIRPDLRADVRPDRPPADRNRDRPENQDLRDWPPPGGFPPEPRPPSPPIRKLDALNFQTRVLLLAADGRVIIGNPAVPRDSPSVPVTGKGGIVGRLLLAPLPELQSEADVTFARSQTRHTLIAGAFVLSCSLLLAWLLARWLLDPIKALSAGSQRLAAGDYQTRIAVNRGDELGVLAEDFNRLADALERNQQARRDWGADIAHELRTPLSILRGEIQALQDGVRPVSMEALASLQAECTRLTALVGDLYQLALSDAGALEYRFVVTNLGAVVMDAVDEHRHALSDAGLALTIDALPANMLVRGDEMRLLQLLGNLLVNARRYTDAPGTIRIRAARVGSDWTLCVEDSAPGVPNNLLPKLFDRLFRVETSRSRAAGGAGLGLAICRNIVEAHGGRIEAGASTLGGLAITVSLPAAAKA